MPWLGVLKLLLSLATGIASIVREKQLLDAGAAQETAQALAKLQSELGVGKQVQAAVEAMGDAELNAALRGDS